MQHININLDNHLNVAAGLKILSLVVQGFESLPPHQTVFPGVH